MSKRVYLILPVLLCILLDTALADESARLFRAVRSNDLTTTKAILDKYPKLVDKVDDLKATSLHWAASDGYLEIVRLLISRGANVNARDHDNARPLHYAASGGHLEISRELIRSGALIDVRNSDGSTPLFYAVDSNFNDIAELLMDNGAKLDAKYYAEEETVLHLAVQNGNITICWKLVEKGANVDSVDIGGETPLHYAAAGGKLEIAALLIQKRAPLDARSTQGHTPLRSAVYFDQYQVAELLVRKGADVNVRDKSGYSLLHIAILEKRPKFVELLVEHGADVNAQAPKRKPITLPHAWGDARQEKARAQKKTQGTEEERESPLGMAMRLKLSDIAQLLRRHGAVE